jgi:hypothetical protein
MRARRLREEKQPVTRIFLASQFWEDRKKLISTIESGVADWADGPWTSQFDLLRRPEFPHLLLWDHFSLDAIHHSVTLDLLRGVKFMVCARSDCRKPFAVESGHERLYCEQYCGHLVSVRRNRLAKRQAAANKSTRIRGNNVAL